MRTCQLFAQLITFTYHLSSNFVSNNQIKLYTLATLTVSSSPLLKNACMLPMKSSAESPLLSALTALIKLQKASWSLEVEQGSNKPYTVLARFYSK